MALRDLSPAERTNLSLKYRRELADIEIKQRELSARRATIRAALRDLGVATPVLNLTEAEQKAAFLAKNKKKLLQLNEKEGDWTPGEEKLLERAKQLGVTVDDLTS